MPEESSSTKISCPGCGKPATKKRVIFMGIERTFILCDACAKAPASIPAEPMTLVEAGLPDRLRSETMNDWKHEDGNKAAYDWYLGYLGELQQRLFDGRSFLLCGRYGTGKTKIAVDIFKRSLELGYRGRYLNNGEIRFNLMRYQSDGAESAAWVSKYRAVRVLLWDDIGQGKLSERQVDFYYQVINYRYDHHMPTFFTTHTNSNELAEVVGEENLSRILGMCTGGGIVKIEGKDRRLEDV